MKKSILAVLLSLVILFAVPAQAQLPTGAETGHLQAGTWYALAYTTWSSRIVTGNSATGAGNTIVVTAPSALADNYTPPITSIFNATLLAPIAVVDANSETVTPTAIAVGSCPTGTAGPIGSQCATITGNFTQLHGASAQVFSGDSGILEASADASAAGGGNVYFQVDTGNLTLSTSGATTTSTVSVPTSFFEWGASCRTTTTITTATSFSVGVSGTTTAFVNTSTQLTAGNQTQMTFLNAGGTKLGTTVVPGVALTPVIVTASATPGAGAVHCRVWGYFPAQSSF